MALRSHDLLLQNVRAHRRPKVSRRGLSRRQLRPRTHKARWSRRRYLHAERAGSKVRLSAGDALTLFADGRRTRALLRQADGGILLQPRRSGVSSRLAEAGSTRRRSRARKKLLDVATSGLRLARNPARLGNDRREEVLDQGARVCRRLLQSSTTPS